MDTQVFEAWLHKKFCPACEDVKMFCEQNGIEFKRLLLLDNAPVHRPSSESLQSMGGEVTTMFLPPSTTLILQPMDQGIVEALKRRCKKSLLLLLEQRRIITHSLSLSFSVPEVVKKISIKDAIYFVCSHMTRNRIR